MKYVDKFLSFTLFVVIACAFCYQAKQLVFFFEKTTRYYSYQELPQNLKSATDEFFLTAKDHNIDASLIYRITYVVVQDPSVDFGGYYLKGFNVLFIQVAGVPEFVQKKLLWHELGHGVLNYDHDLRPNSSHLMTPAVNFTSIPWEVQKQQFFNESISTPQYKLMWNVLSGGLWHEAKLREILSSKTKTMGLVFFIIVLGGFYFYGNRGVKPRD